MTLRPVSIALAVLLGLIGAGTIDSVDAAGSPRWVAWAPFALALALVVRDTVFSGSFLTPLAEARERLSGMIEQRNGDLRVRVWRFEPVATTVAILTGLGASGAVDFQRAGEGTDWAWAAFGLSVFLAVGGRLAPRPKRRRQREAEAEQKRAHIEMVFDQLRREFRSR